MSDAARCLAAIVGRASPARRRRIGATALALVFLGLTLPAFGARGAAAAPREAASRPHVYLMRGLMNIFSLGMDELAAKIAQHGIAAEVYNHTQADGIVAEIAAKYRAGDHGPYMLIGHSLGADAVMMMAQSLDRAGVPVALVIPFDGTGSYAASKNVSCVINMTQRTYAYMRAGSGFHGRLSNVDVRGSGVDHFTIDKSPQLQAQALNFVLQTAHGESCRPAVREPAVAKPATEPAEKHAAPVPAPEPTPVEHTGSAG